LIAYSSVRHISLVLGGILCMSYWGIRGILVIILGHGLGSSCMFFIANLFYDRVKRRNIIILKGLGYFNVGVIIFWFIVCAVNLGLPLRINFLGEVILIVGLLKYDFFNLILIIIISFLGACFSLYLFIQIFHGKSWFISSFIGTRMLEFNICLLHVLPLFLYVLKLKLYFEIKHPVIR